MRVLLVCLFAVAAAQNLVFEDDDNNKCTFSYDGTAVATDCDFKAPSLNEIEAKLACDKGLEKANGNMGDQCVACPAGQWKAEVGYHACISHTPCGAGQGAFPAGTATTDSTCAPCPSGTYSTGWGNTCHPHTTCSPGQYLLGESAEQDGTCTACPAGSYNADGSGDCDWHGNCPKGKEPSHLSKTSASTCVPCSGGTYSDKVDRSACQSWRTCRADQSLVGESATRSGTCHNACFDQYTRSNDDGSRQGLKYLDRHDLVCPQNTALGAVGMSRYQLQRTNRNRDIRYAFKCCDVDKSSEAARTISNADTACNDDGNSDDTIYLDRHNVNCGANKVIQSMHLRRCRWGGRNNNGFFYDVDCVSKPAGQCQSYNTRCSDDGPGNGRNIYFDRHNVQCPTGKPFMQGFKMNRCDRNRGIYWNYKCCA